jgi:TonB family protein
MGVKVLFRLRRIPSSQHGSEIKMKQYVVFFAGTILLLSLIAAPAGPKTHKSSQFSPPGITSAGNIAYPVNTLASGAVSLLLSLDGSANIQNVQVLRDSPPLTSSVQDAVQLWTFTPASLKGNPVASEISVTAIFNIFNPAGGAASQNLALAPAQPVYPDASQFMPPQITSATFANYPVNSVAQGTVVLDVTVGAAGQPKQIRVIYDVPTLTQQAVSAVKTWGFNAATIKGQPVLAHVIIAFVFQRNMS